MVTQNQLGSPLTAFLCNPCFMKKYGQGDQKWREQNSVRQSGGGSSVTNSFVTISYTPKTQT